MVLYRQATAGAGHRQARPPGRRSLAPISAQSFDAQGRDQPLGYRTRKFGSWERSQELDARVAAEGKAEGIDFAFDRIARTPNTLDTHRLIWLADKEDIQDAVVERLFVAYFIDGRDISNRQQLIDVVAEAGLDRNKGEAVLDIDDEMTAFKESEKLARRHAVDGVPFFIINDRVTLAEAQQPVSLLEAFRLAVGQNN
jgi:predicted DsbA family dithiol-disulfide isomerase